MERVIQTIQHECLDDFVILGQRHFDYLVSEWLERYHEERPHQGTENDLLVRSKVAAQKKAQSRTLGIRCRERLGGLVKHYYRQAA